MGRFKKQKGVGGGEGRGNGGVIRVCKNREKKKGFRSRILNKLLQPKKRGRGQERKNFLCNKYHWPRGIGNGGGKEKTMDHDVNAIRRQNQQKERECGGQEQGEGGDIPPDQR